MGGVKTYAELNTAALRRREERQLSLWYILRGLDPTGKGYVPLDDLRAFVTEHSLFSGETLRRTLRKGEDVYWIHDLKRDNICYMALLKLAGSLAVDLRQQPVILSLDDLRGVVRLRATLMGTLFDQKSRIMSRSTMAKLTGRTAQTTRHYCKALKEAGTLRVADNAMLSARKPTDLDSDLQQQGYYRSIVNGETRLLKRMPNSYTATHDLAAFGQVKHCDTSFTTRGEMRYFTNATAAVKTLHKTDTGNVVYLATNTTDAYNTRLWVGTTTIPELGVTVTY